MAVVMRATLLYNRFCGRVPYRVCFDRACYQLRAEARS